MTGTASPAARRPPSAEPLPTSPRCVSGSCTDGRWWKVLTAADAVTAIMSTGTVGEARVSERGEQVVVELWADEPGVPAEVSAQLVTQAFAAPAVRQHRPVLVCVPRRDGALLAQAHLRVRDARTRAAGVTCLIEGHVSAAPPEAPRP